ncbi:hypothetical protein NL320_27065, partial [Klebsiella pneumoniae]|nr:hypothetical protein [Klebsiella pneumoniae]
PTAFDRVLATRLGSAATDLVADDGWGQMVVLRGTEIERAGFDEALANEKTVPQRQYEEARRIFG